MLKKARLALIAAAALIAVAALAFLAGKFDLFRGRTVEKSLVVTILKSEEMNFLVTRRLASTVVLEKKENSVWLGNRQGILFADVELYYGFNLDAITPDAITVDGTRITVAMPDPAILTTAVNLESMRFFTKQSGLSRLADLLNNQDIETELRNEFAAAARQYFAARNMMPPRHEMLASLNRWATPRFAAAGLTLKFE